MKINSALRCGIAATAILVTAGLAYGQQSGSGTSSGGAASPGTSSAPSPTTSAPKAGSTQKPAAQSAPSGGDRSTGQAPGLDRQDRAPAGAGSGSDRSQERRTGETTKDDGRAGDRKTDSGTATQPNKAEQNRSADQKGDKPAASGSAGANVNVTTEQQTRLRTVVTRTNIREVNNLNVSVSVGTVLPATVELVELPSDIVEIVPQFRSYRVIKVGGRLLIIEPSSRRIVYIINI